MRLRVGFELAYRCDQPTPMVLMVSLHPSEQHKRLSPEVLRVDNGTPVRSYHDMFGNLCHRLVAPAGVTTFSSDFLVRSDDEAERLPVGLPQHEIDDLPDDVLVYLLRSRYADTEKLGDTAWRLFGGVAPGWPRVQAILDYVKGRVRFSYPEAREDRTAWDTHEERVGVCRDYSHLTVAFCRAMNIPARYVTGWLGDIRWPFTPGPMDFSGWTQVYLGGRWWDVDGRHNTPRHGRVLMAVGRDATDVAISTAWGRAGVEKFYVIADEVEPPADWAGSNHHHAPLPEGVR